MKGGLLGMQLEEQPWRKVLYAGPEAGLGQIDKGALSGLPSYGDQADRQAGGSKESIAEGWVGLCRL